MDGTATVAARSLFIVFRFCMSGTKLGEALPAEPMAPALVLLPFPRPACPLRTQFLRGSGLAWIIVRPFLPFDTFVRCCTSRVSCRDVDECGE